MSGRLPGDGVYYATKTLLGCAPDRNRRHVYRWPSDKPVLVMNQDMRPWTKRDALHLNIILTALNAVHDASKDIPK